jgi:hypothetical protein
MSQPTQCFHKLQTYLSVVWLLLIAETLAGFCPNDCMNNGLCNFYYECECYSGFTGPDCSQRKSTEVNFVSISISTSIESLRKYPNVYVCYIGICPMDLAWVDKPSGLDTAHALSECSNQGLCDRFSVSLHAIE